MSTNERPERGVTAFRVFAEERLGELVDALIAEDEAKRLAAMNE